VRGDGDGGKEVEDDTLNTKGGWERKKLHRRHVEAPTYK